MGLAAEEAGNHAAAVQAYRDCVDLEPRRAQFHRALGKALMALHDWEGAADAIRRTMELRPAPVDHHRLGKVLAKSSDWAGAAEAFQRAVDADGTEPRYHLSLGAAWLRLEAWDAAAVSFERAVELRPSAANLVKALQGSARAKDELGRRDSALASLRRASEVLTSDPLLSQDAALITRIGRLHLRLDDVNGARDAFAVAVEAEPGDPGAHYRYGLLLASIEDWAGAIEAFERALSLDARDARVHYRLGIARQKLLGHAPTIGTVVGLVADASREWDTIEACYRSAVELDPGTAEYHYRLGQARLRKGDRDGAVAALEEAIALDGSRPTWHYFHGRAIAEIGNQRGAHRPEELEAASRAYGRAVELDPSHGPARVQLTRIQIRRANWRRASLAAWHPERDVVGGLSRADEVELRSVLESPRDDAAYERVGEILARPTEQLRAVPVEWWFPLHWRLISCKRFHLAYRAKDIMAERLLETHGDATRPGDGIEVVRALTYLGREGEALDRLRVFSRDWRSEALQSLIRKLTADVRLALGDPADHIEFRRLHESAGCSLAEQRFKEMVQGREVAIVGPADADLPQGAEIDQFDTVIRTKFIPDGLAGHAETAGTRTDLSYYAIGSTSLLGEQIGRALRDGHLQMVVFRTPKYENGTRHIEFPGDLRYMPSEYRVSLRASQFAIQRIIYDVIRYEPARIKLFNMNFFAAANPYRTGYNLDPTQSFEAHGLQRPLEAFAHDFRSDFVLTKRWQGAGLVETDPVAADVLRLSTSEYLEVLADARTSVGPDLLTGPARG
jgi:tetratricopeptide (TPR) repeat protein